jgi:hypothetical protein
LIRVEFSGLNKIKLIIIIGGFLIALSILGITFLVDRDKIDRLIIKIDGGVGKL